MNNFSAKSISVLSVLSLLALIGFFAVEQSKSESKQTWYNEKLEAARLDQTATEFLREQHLQKGVFVDVINDPNNTGLIGQEYTLITTDRGSLISKLTSTNPNFAAVILQMLKDAGVKEGDYVAVSMTGSFPALNIAAYSAMETLKLKPLVISSVGASNWGANDPYFTWLDMEKVLYDGKIFKTRSLAASIGGGQDRGQGLSPRGRQLLLNAIERNKIELINENYLEKNIERRLAIYRQKSQGKPIKAYINIGGGMASLGNSVNSRLIKPGLSLKLAMRNYPARGVIIRMAQEGIPIIHLLNINKIARRYGLPVAPTPLPEPGTGEIFVQLKYNLLLTIIVTFVLIAAIMAVYFLEKRRHRLGTESVPLLQTQLKDRIEDPAFTL